MKLSKKINMITPSYTIGISSKVKALRAEGKTIIDLSIGEPDFFTPEPAKQSAIDAINRNESKYDVVPGLIDLRRAISKKLSVENGVEYSESEIVVSSGAKHAITNALMAILDPSDEIIVPKPYWTSYPEMIRLCGGNPIFIDSLPENQYKITSTCLKNAITDKTKALLLNNPSNPTGAIYSKDELKELVSTCIENSIYIIADEIYEKIHYTDEFTSIPSISSEAKEITLLINGLSKSVAMTGWRIGYTATNPVIAKAITTLQGHLVSHPCLIAQWAGVSALNDCSEDVKKMVATYKQRRDILINELNKIPEITYVYPDGAFYLFINIAAYKEKFKSTDSFSVSFCDQFLGSTGVAVVPGIAFGEDDFIRISYATELELVIEGLSRLKEFLSA